MPDLVAIDLPAGPAFVDALRRVWDDGDAALPVDQRLAGPARRLLLDTMAPSRVIGPAGTSPAGTSPAGTSPAGTHPTGTSPAGTSPAGGRPRTGGRPVEAGDALVVATSGTTGVPKGVVLTHDAVAASARATSAALGVDPTGHRWLSCLPLNHVGGLSVVCRALITGTPLDVLPGFDLEAVVAASGPEVLVSLVATTLARVGAERFRTVVLGGSAPPATLAANVVTTYGMTETGSGVVYDGRPLPGVEVALDPVTSEVRLRGPMLLRAYRDGSVPLDADGWLATGDAGRFDDEGRLAVEGRLSELIITGGENVWPTPVETVLAGHPGVAEVAVAGRADPEWGERVVAWVIPTDPSRPPALDELRDRVRATLAPFSAPRQLVLVDTLPKTAIGKVQRALLPDPPA